MRDIDGLDIIIMNDNDKLHCVSKNVVSSVDVYAIARHTIETMAILHRNATTTTTGTTLTAAATTSTSRVGLLLR